MLPYAAVIECVDSHHTPDRLEVRGQVVEITSGMATALCLKMHVPELRAAPYRLDRRAAGAR